MVISPIFVVIITYSVPDSHGPNLCPRSPRPLLSCNKMADLQRANANCVSQEEFYKVEKLKRQQKTKDSKITLYLEDNFYDKAKSFLKEKMVNQLELSQNDREEPSEVSLFTKWEDATITQKQWIYKNNKVFTQDNKEVIPKRELFQVLSHAHR